MFSIEQSAFLQALGKAIGNSLWQVAALWLLYMAISSAGKLSANRKYQFAAGASLAGLVLFIITLITSWVNVSQHSVGKNLLTETTTEVGSSTTDYLLYIYHSAAASLRSLAPYISCAYLCMFLLLCIRLVNGFRQVRFFATADLGKASVDVRMFIEQHAAALGISRKVKIFTSRHIQSPLTLGFLKPIILLPVATLNHLTTAQVESILLHELAHIRRHDYLVNILLQVAEISLFFNPFMRLLLKQVKQERENSCDDYVLQFQYNPKDYAKALLAIERSNNTMLLALAAKGNQSFQLLNRVKRMVAPEPKAFNYRQQLGLLLLFTVLLLSFTIIVPQPKKAAAKKAVSIEKIAINTQSTQTQNTDLQNALTAMPAIPAPPGIPAIDVVKLITGGLTIDEKKLNATLKQVEANAATYEHIGKEVEQQVQPMVQDLATFGKNVANADWQSWGRNIENADWKGWGEELKKVNWDAFMKDSLTTAIAFEKLKMAPFKSLINIAPRSDKGLKVQLNNIVKNAIAEDIELDLEPVFRNINLAFQWNDEQEKRKADREKEQALAAAIRDREKAIHDQAKRQAAMQVQIQKLQQLTIADSQKEMRKLEMEARKLEAMAKAQQLHLGVLTDDRDSTINGLLACVQKQFTPQLIKLIKNKNIHVQQSSQHGKARCSVSVANEDVEVTTDDEDVEWPVDNIQINGQRNTNIHLQKQSSNKEEKIVITTMHSSR